MIGVGLAPVETAATVRVGTKRVDEGLAELLPYSILVRGQLGDIERRRPLIERLQRQRPIRGEVEYPTHITRFPDAWAVSGD
jgi:hypothetical protein